MMKYKNLKIFDVYIISMVALATIVAIIAFIVVWISPETLFKVIHRVSYGHLTLQQGLEWLFFEIPTILGKAIPVGLLLGSLVITDMLSRNFELVIFRSIGISFWRIARPIIVLSSVFAIFCFFAYNTFIPYSSQRVENIKSGGGHGIIQWSYLEKDLFKIQDVTVYEVAPTGIFNKIEEKPEMVILEGKTANNANKL